jgi:hypothetical protein
MLPYITFAEARLKSELPSILASIKIRKMCLFQDHQVLIFDIITRQAER